MPQYKVRTTICQHCGKVETKRQRGGKKFCSLECYRSSPRPDRKTGVDTTCGSCGKSIYVAKSQIKPINYCSKECHDAAQSKKHKYVCKTCGTDFYWSPSRAEQSPKYCSLKCRTDCPEWKRNSVINANLSQQRKKGLNKLELAGREILEYIGVPFQEQVLLFDKFCVDVFLPDHNIAIQWDGDYWHGYNGAKDERQKQRQQLDKSQNAYMSKVGVKVLRFWEHEVKNEREKVIENIRRAIQ